MRLAPAVIAAPDETTALRWAADQSRTTHGARAAVDACRVYARLIWRALGGLSKTELLNPGLSADLQLEPAVAAVAAGSYHHKQPPQIRGTGYVVDALEAALWAFAHGTDFAAGAILAVNLGQDADTTGAIYGQMAGACYGLNAIPADWRDKLLWSAQLVTLADGLHALIEGVGS